MEKPKALLSWETPEYVHTEKSADWYWAVGIIAISVATTAVLFDNTIFGIFIILSLATLMLYANRKPDILKIRIDERGIQDGPTRYPYSSLESFCIEDQEIEHKIILKSKKKLQPYIVIPIRDVSADDVHKQLKRFLREDEHTEPLAKRIVEYLGF